METRANFILIGAFTLLAILGTLGFFIWLASVQIDRQYATYGILFDDVSGLDPSGDVLFNGISVGKVIGLEIYAEDPSKVLTTVEIDKATPVTSGTVAQLQSQGVTGVAYISLSGGALRAGPIEVPETGLPMIASKRSTVQALVEDAPDLLAQATELLKQFQSLTGAENQAYVTRILRNLDASSGQLDQALTDFSSITGTVSDATAQITQFTGRLDRIGSSVQTTLEKSNSALEAAQRAFDTADQTMTASGAAIKSVEGTFAQSELLLRDRVPEILAGIAAAVARTDAAIADLQNRSGDALDGFGQTADLLNARLTELAETLAKANTAFVAVTDASDSFDTLVSGEGAVLVGDARAVLADAKVAIATIQSIVEQDVPVIMTDIRTAVAAASDAVDSVAKDVTGLTGRFDPMAAGAEQALESANALFTRAQTSLGALDGALGSAQGALVSAETAFDGANDVLRTDVGPMLSDLRTAADRISVAVEDVTRDIPAIATDLRALISRADSVVAQVQGAVSASAPGISGFAKAGLPELTRLSAEARSLVSTLSSLARRIENNPAGFILDNRVPDYRK